MTLEYEYYANYDPDSSGEVNLEGHILDWLRTMELMVEFVKFGKPEILDLFLETVAGKYRSDLGQDLQVLSDLGLDRILEDESVLGFYESLKDLALQLIMKNIPFREGYFLSEEKEAIRWFDYCRAKYMLLYHGIATLVEILGREQGVAYYKDFVEHWGKELARKGKSTITLAESREAWVKSWASGGMNFGVVDFDNHMYLCKFDKCVSHESMKHVEDQELADYVVCYPAPRIQRHTLENVRLRRSVTLFIGDFCDELRWDPNAHDEPEQPSHEFSRKIVPK